MYLDTNRKSVSNMIKYYADLHMFKIKLFYFGIMVKKFFKKLKRKISCRSLFKAPFKTFSFTSKYT